MQVRQSAEDYFETIYMLKRKNGSVRAIDVVNELGFSKPTVSVAMKKFRENGFVTVDEAGQIELTEAGLAIAKKTFEKHTVISEMLIMLGVPEEIALEDACRMEHGLSDESFAAMKEHLNKAKEMMK